MQPFSNRPPPNRTCTFQRIRLSSDPLRAEALWMFRMVSALRITRTFTSCHPVHLSPFAVCQAFPGSDYYGDSVAVGVAPVRQSRVPHPADVQDGLGVLFVPFFRPLKTAQLPRGASPCQLTAGRVASALFSQRVGGSPGCHPPFPVRLITVRALGFRQCSFHLAIRVLPNTLLGGFAASRLSRHAIFPSRFPLQVGLATQEHRTQFLRCCTGISRVVTRRTRVSLLSV
jgi:hypothetical protein